MTGSTITIMLTVLMHTVTVSGFSMMEKRLKIAKKLLNPKDSVMIVTIDEKEYLHLGCLLEETFFWGNDANG